MNDMTQRDAFWNKVYDLAKADRNVVLVSADMGAPSLDRYRTDLACQFVNVGIAEQNAVVIGAGLALAGKRAFVYAIAPFVTLRCLEQIRVESGMMNIPITLVGVGAGVGYEDSGPTHHLMEDIAIMRAMPNITINSISDNVMARAMAEMSVSMTNTNYVRLDRKPFNDIYDERTDFGQGVAELGQGDDGCIVATGCMVHTALQIAERLKEKNLSIGVVDVYTFPINTSLLMEKIGRAKRIITMEEHFLPGGLGSAVCETLADAGALIAVKRIGFPVEKGYCYIYGGREEIRKYYGIGQDEVLKQVVDFVSG